MPSGWFPDPHGRYDHRWFNGTSWTADVADEGRRLVDPLGAAPSGFRSPDAAGGNGIATAAITCGLIGVFFAWMPVLVVIGLVLGVLGLVFGIRGVRKARLVGSGRGRALTGAIAGGASIALSVVGIALTVGFVREFRAFIEPGAVEAEVVGCSIDGGVLIIDAVLTNRSDTSREYTLYGVVRDPRGVDDLVAEVPEVAPGTATDVELRRLVGDDDQECTARLVVQGPLPYGIEVDRVDD
jgi:hypothetical protein